MKNETALSVVAKAIVDDAYARGFEAAKESARRIIEGEILSNYTHSRNPVSVLSQVSAEISELKPEVPQ